MVAIDDLPYNFEDQIHLHAAGQIVAGQRYAMAMGWLMNKEQIGDTWSATVHPPYSDRQAGPAGALTVETEALPTTHVAMPAGGFAPHLSIFQ